MMPGWAVSLLVTFRGRVFLEVAAAMVTRWRPPGFRCTTGCFTWFCDGSGPAGGISAAGAGLLAMVMTAVAVRVIVSFGPA